MAGTTTSSSSGGSGAAAALSIFGGVLDAIGGIYGGYLNKSVAKYQSRVAEANANLNLAQADLVKQNIELRKYRTAKEMKTVMGKQIAGYTKAGVTLKGSPIDVITSSRANMELELALQNINDSLVATGYQTEASLNLARGKKVIAQGYESVARGYANAYRSLLNSGTKSAIRNYNPNQNKPTKIGVEV